TYILPQIEQLLHRSDLDLDQLDYIAYNQGPGSFTGLRIGLSVALGLAYAKKITLVPIPTFFLYLEPQTKAQNLIVTLDARLGQIYLAVFNQTSLNYLIPPCLINPQELMQILAEAKSINPENSLIVGNGFEVYQAQLDPSLNNFNYQNYDYPTTQNMLNLVKQQQLPSCPLFEADLLYLRNKVALNLTEQKNARDANK
ncbi:MAG: tRNA ((37)-N6)-threonylcarbamoyltransferase complex dimerization subunit type 1 TsaB, partial [Pseudomonadota bacterium]